MSQFMLQRSAVATIAGTIIALAGTSSAHAQAFHELVDGGLEEQAFAVCATSDGGYATAGQVYDRVTFRSDMLVVRYDAFGSVLWSVRYGLPDNNEAACSIEETPNGDFVVSGNTDALGPDLDVAVIRLDGNGSLIWARAYEGDQRFDDFVWSYQGGQILDTLPDGDTVIVGRKIFQPEGVAPLEHAGHVLRINAAGAVVFNNAYLAPINPETGLRREVTFIDVQSPGPNAGLALVGTINPDFLDDQTGQDKDILAVRLTGAGAPAASRTFGIQTLDPDTGEVRNSLDVGAGLDVAQSPVFQLVIAARAGFGEFGDQTGTTFLRLDSTLAPVTLRVYRSPEYQTMEPASGAIRTSDIGQIVLGGNSFYGDGGVSPWMMLLEANGDLVWSEYYLGQAFAEGVLPPAKTEPTAGFVLAGYAGNFSYGTQPSDVYLLRSDVTGRTGCEESCFRAELVEAGLENKEVELEVRELQRQAEFPGQWRRLDMAAVTICAGRLCPADVNNDGSVDFGDFLDFFNGYDNLDPSTGDVNGDCQVDFADFLEFFNLYDTVCGIV